MASNCTPSLALQIQFALSKYPPMPPHVFVDFVVLPPGHGRSVTDFWVYSKNLDISYRRTNSLSSSYICHRVGPLVDPFRSHVPRSLFKGLPWFLLPVGEWYFITLGFFFLPNAPQIIVDFVVFPPGHGRNVTDFWGWDAHEAQLRCPDDVSGDIGGCSARRALKPKFY